jgi:hypothetical protein
MSKVCPKCGVDKPEDSFYFLNVAHTKRDSWCKDCKNKATIKIDGQQKYLGTYPTLEEAKQVRREAVIKFHKEFAYLG